MPAFVVTNVGTAGLYDPTSGAALASFSKMESIGITIDSKMTEVYGGPAAYPMINILADRKPVIDLKGPEMNLGAFYRILGATNTAASSGSTVQMPVIEDYVIPSGANPTVTLQHTPSTVNTTLTVIGIIDDTAFTSTASSPTTGQYSISGNTLTLNTGDAGKAIRVFYDYDTSTGGKIGVSSAAIPGTYTFKAVGKYLQNVNDPAKTAYDIAIVIKSCQLVGNIQTSMERQKASAQSIQLDILDPGNGQNPIEIRTTAKYA